MDKKFRNIIIIDGSYLIQRGLHVPNLWELRNKNGERSGGIFQFLRSLNYICKDKNYYPVVTWDSGLSNRRLSVYPRYKNNHLRVADRILRSSDSIDEVINKITNTYTDRDMITEMMDSINEALKNSNIDKANKYDPDDFRSQYRRQRDLLITILSYLGIPSIKINGWEGDDLMVLLTRLSERSIVVTDDKDLIQLISPTIDILRPMNDKYLVYMDYLTTNGYKSSRQIAMIKSIVGDPSDSIPSVTSGLDRKYCVGYKRAVEISGIIIDSNEDEEVYCKKLTEIGKNPYLGFVYRLNDYKRNMQLVDLSLVENDTDVVNSIIYEVSRTAGKCNLLKAMKSLSEQDISDFDTSSVIAKNLVLGSNLIIR